MIEYIIREATDPARLVVLVNGSISEGWIPLGGISITGDSFSITHCQALTREKKSDK